ncbi:hypothetical protein VTN31DRAFT_5477 [Thermomyces dupontii]|uniref:uncharacterized protein n=1 Tax=Talaromyces thermophilus TaxID=28565 RepID=UPI00374378B4
MLLRLPPGLHYPITVTSLLKQPGDTVDRDEAIFWYVYQTTVTEGDGLGNKIDVVRDYPTRFQSTVDGKVVEWKIRKGDVIHGPIDVVEIDEPCSHEIQFGGMCAECGKDMTAATYNTDVMDSMRAPIQMVHDNTALTVSEREATRVEEDAKRRLLSTRRLSLVVDLDQTIIHATVDPTVGEWKEDESNPNHNAVKDVRAFQLTDDAPGMRGCWYYIKLRPGLEQFLQNISKLYELHIYTMGTRAYAQNIAKIIDPDGKLFGDRILSRDESGSLTAKNLQRLFPVDTKMVVIIDDRGDVWRWNHNLIKVSPYDFFVGIGDINSSFLPKKPELTPAPGAGKGKATAETTPDVNGVAAAARNGETDMSTVEQLVSMGGGDDPSLLQLQATQQEETIMHQVEDRPLLQKQKELDAEEAAESQASETSSVDESRHRHHLLEDHDTELYQLEERLEKVHRMFFEEYDRRRAQRPAKDGDGGDDDDVDLEVVPDVKTLIPQIKRPVLDGVVIVFSGVLPLGTDVQNADISLWAKSFGAVISTRIGSRVTHLVAGRNRTAKVREATRYPKIKIVTTQWLLDSLTAWQRLDEAPYLVPVHPEDRGNAVAESSPSKEDLDDDWLSGTDEDTGVSLSDEEMDEELLQPSGIDSFGPIGYDAEQAEEVHNELKEFLGSEDESSTDSEIGLTAEAEAEPESSKKRKREPDESEETGPTTTEEGQEGPDSRPTQRVRVSREGAGPNLKEALARDDQDPDAAGGDGYPEDPDDDDDALEREMLAAFEDGGYDQTTEDEVAAENG